MLSPSGFVSNRNAATIWYGGAYCQLAEGDVDSDLGLRPVINLNSNVLATGTGTSTDPYVIQTN